MSKSEREILAHEMERYAERHDTAVTTLGRLAGNGGDFYARLISGKGRMFPETLDKVRDYMRDNPDGPPKKTEDIAAA